VRRLYPLVVVAVAAAIGVWALAAGGRESVAFLVLATCALGWVVWLLFRAAESLVREQPPVDPTQVTGRRRKQLEREKQALLKALKELEFDHQMGKVSDKDFAEIGQQYRARAIRVMRQLDEGGQQYEALIAKELAARLKKPVAPSEESRATPAAATAPETQPVAEGRIGCKSCGTSNDGDAEFCKKCGARLTATETAS
jgi:hypothetical protein